MAQLRPVDLEGRVALVTAGTGEVGAAFVDLLGSAGAEVAVAAEPGPALERMAIRSGVETFELDPESPGGLDVAADSIAERLGRLDVLVCLLGPDGADPDATFAALRGVARAMVGGGRGGRIVLVVGSGEELTPRWIRSAAAELAADRVTVNGVFYGILRSSDPDDWEDEARGLVVGTVEATDIARAALWLLDPEIEGVTGAIVDLDSDRPDSRSGGA